MLVGTVTSAVVISITQPDLDNALAVVTLVLVRFARQPAHYSDTVETYYYGRPSQKDGEGQKIE